MGGGWSRIRRREDLYIKPPYSRPPPLTHSFSIGTPSSLFRQICGNSRSDKLCGNKCCSHKLFRQALWEQALFPQICWNRLLSLIPRSVLEKDFGPPTPLKSVQNSKYVQNSID